MRLSWDETVGAYMDIRGEGSPLYPESNSKRTRILPSVLDAEDSSRGLSFARGGGSYDSIHFVESSKTFTLTPGDFLLLDNVAFDYSLCVRALAYSIGFRAASHSSIRSVADSDESIVFYCET
jgi:hypothetical protein